MVWPDEHTQTSVHGHAVSITHHAWLRDATHSVVENGRWSVSLTEYFCWLGREKNRPLRKTTSIME